MSLKIAEHKAEFEKVIAHFKDELAKLRTGRANAAALDDVTVMAYGAPMQLKAVGNIANSDARTIVFTPWDKSLLKDVEKAITEARLGTNPIIDGEIIRLSFPALTEETRKQVVKQMRELWEESKIGIRKVREELKGSIAKAEQEGEIAEDERFRMQGELDIFVKEFNERLEKMAEEKEKEIMTI